MGLRLPHGGTRRLLLALVPLLVALEIPGAVELWHRPDPGMVLRDHTVMVVDSLGAAQRAGVRPGDHVVGLAGREIPNYAAFLAALQPLRVGGEASLQVERAGRTLSLQLPLRPRAPHLRFRDYLLSAVALCFLFLGFVTYLRRGDALGRYFHACCLLFAYPFLDLPTFASWPVMAVLESVRDVLLLLLPAVFLRFFLIFPEGIREESRLRRRQRWIMLPPLLLAPPHVLYNLRPDMPGAHTANVVLQIVTALLFAGYLLTALVVFVRKARRQDRWVLWSKLRLAVLGLSVGLLPLVLATVLRQILPAQDLVIGQAAVLFLPLVPASFSVALLRTGAIDLAYLTRQSLIGLGLGIPLLLVVGTLLFLVGPLLDGQQRLLAYAGAAIAILVVGTQATPVRRQVGRWVDRVLYPEQLAIRAASTELGHELSQLRDPEEVASRLCEGLRRLFQSSSVELYRVGENRLTRIAHAGLAQRPDPPEEVPREANLLTRALESREMVLVEPLLVGARARALDEPSRRLLATTDAVLLCPLSAGGEVIALLLLGPSLDGEPYGTLHLYHVQLIARQAALSFENALLHQEDLARERHRLEMDVAREIQSELLPQVDLRVDGYCICGRMHSSEEVGGDLFDHFALPDGNLVLTVADAAGKGVPGSLLMSSVRTAVRETMRPGIELPEAIVHLNRHVHGSTGIRHFIALFLGVLDPRNGVLEYVVAGIDPPLWLRTALSRVEILSRGGPVLGIDPTAGYRTGLIRMMPGDVVVAYSDGMVDEEDAAGAAYGRESLIRSAEGLLDRDARGILDGMMDAVLDFGAGSAVDDRTLLVLKRDPGEARGMKSATSGG